MDLSPAKWIWLPSRRTLANTFVLFRKEFDLASVHGTAKGWILADSRYRLIVNGQRVQWGPAPQDPRWGEVDPVDIAPYLRVGKNVIGVEVLFYGHGEGTWPFGKPGLLLKIDVGNSTLLTNKDWRCHIDRAHRPGQYRRWYLRSLQEEFDAREHPFGWDQPGFDDATWLPAMELNVPASRTSYSGGYSDYANEVWYMHPQQSTLIERTVPLLKEEIVPAAKLINSGAVDWKRPAEDWFDFRVPGSFEIKPDPFPKTAVLASEARFLTYEFDDEIVGWPRFSIDAPAGTIVELMVQESHDPARTPWLDSHYFAWSRFICREGVNQFEAFDYECLKFMQLHIRGHSRDVKVGDVSVRRRQFAWPNEPRITVSDPALQTLFEASINTLHNCAQDIIVDGMGRERQQYSGDGSHQLHAIRYAFGENRLPERFLRTFAQGQFLDGVFSDSWPAVDRLQRLWERNVDSSGWGPLVDHSVGFCFDHYHHWMQTGDREPARQNWPRLMKFVEYLKSIRDEHGLLRVESLGVNAVWIDHDAFKQQRHKQCAFNLYASAMLRNALAPLALALDPPNPNSPSGFTNELSRQLQQFGGDLQVATIWRFWEQQRQVFISNKPWMKEEGEVRLDDRSLATTILYGSGDQTASMSALANEPPEMGRSYPANIPWNFWALGKARRVDVILKQMRQRWAPMYSVLHNNSLQEHWTITPDTSNILSHCALAPLIALYQVIMGLNPTQPAFAEFELDPQLGDLESIDLTAYTVVGPVRLAGRMTDAGHQIRIETPAGTNGFLKRAGERIRIEQSWQGTLPRG